MNPFAEDAAVNVGIQTDHRTAVRPGALTPFIVPAGTSTEIRLNQFLLQAPDEKIVSADVRVELGRVVVSAVDLSTGGMATEIAEPRESSRWGLPAAGFTGGSTLNVMNPAGRRSDFTVIAQSETRQQVLSGVDGLSLSRGEAIAFAVPDESATGLAVESTNKAPVAVQRRVVGTDGEPAIIGGAESTAPVWLLPSTLPPRGGRALLVVQNPGRESAEIALRLFGASGSLFGADRTFSVPAGRSLTIDLSAMTGQDPAAALVTASSGTIVVGGASYASDGGGFSATLAIPVDP